MDTRQVAHPPVRPLGIFDGDCGFCRAWIARWRAQTGANVDYAPSQEVAGRFPEIPSDVFRRAFVLVLPDGRALDGAEAVFATLAQKPGAGRLSAAYARVPGFAALAEGAYRIIASHRDIGAALTRWLWGSSVEKPTYLAASALFLRLLGLCYLAAFVSFWVQADGLVGSHGILPFARYLDWVRGQTGDERFWLLPTLSWLSPTDNFLHVLCGAGVVASVFLVLGWLPVPSSVAAWALYLSVAIDGQVFLEFQWDYLLLEAGFLAIWLAPPLKRRFGAGVASSTISRWLLRWLLFRLMFSSGWVKLASGDVNWRRLTALRYHYETQPLPPWTAWFMHQMPPWFHTVSALFMFFVELVVPFFFFAPRRLRTFAFRITVLFQVLIAATGNYAFFNALAITLAVLLIDDQSLPQRWARAAASSAIPVRTWPRAILVSVAVVVFVASTVEFAASLDRELTLPESAVTVMRDLGAIRSFNGYGLFMVMTTERPEIIVEGSRDGTTWQPYEFRYKPGDPIRRPRFVEPHQPRLDWQMWFAALGGYEQNLWVRSFLGRLLEGSPAVTGLLAKNPFAGNPPRYVRAVLYDYRFTDAAERRRTGAWWRRRELGLFCPVFEGVR
ncbi:MAG TPA: lipase maturation factor family protein [Thermoanaerobaculia bacterium]|nr:lipase maturation factor family protein [Thermoanaerobaculia bacterium]